MLALVTLEQIRDCTIGRMREGARIGTIIAAAQIEMISR
jgi:hypothetical protein